MDIINVTHSSDEHSNCYETTTTFHTSYYEDYEKITNFHTPHYDYSEIRLSIFFIGAVCVGLPCLIWAFYSVHRLRKAKGGISAFIILLLLSDLLQLILYPYIVAKLLIQLHSYNEEIFIIIIFGCLKICSLHLHQLVALEWILTLKYPAISARMFSLPCCIMISIIIVLIPVISVVLLAFGGVYGHFSTVLIFGSILASVCLLVVTGIIIFKATPTAASTPVNHRPGAKVFTVSLVTLLVLYLPCVLICCVHILHLTNRILFSCIMMAFCLISLTVISEPLLCVLVCRENLSALTKRTKIEVKIEDTSV